MSLKMFRQSELEHINYETILIVHGYIRVHANKSYHIHIPSELIVILLHYIDTYFMMYRNVNICQLQSPNLAGTSNIKSPRFELGANMHYQMQSKLDCYTNTREFKLDMCLESLPDTILISS